jgi:lambda family phage portal protein
MGNKNRQQRRQNLQSAPIPQAQAATDTGFGGGGSGYDGANSSTARTAFFGFPTNSITETNPFTRKELTRKARALGANLPIILRIVTKIAQHAIGKGVFVRPATKDKEWNEEARRLFEEWASNPGVYSIDGSVDHYRHQLLAVETMIQDGDHFAAMVASENGAPMLQLFDSFEVDSPYYPSAANAQNYVDGIRVNAYNRPVGYSVRELTKPYDYSQQAFREVPKDSMIHLFDRRRVKQFRGLTWFFSGINQGIDALDLRALVTGTAKLHESMAVAVSKGAKVGRSGVAGKVQAHAGGTPADDDFKALEKVYGGGMISYLGAEGKIEILSSDRPSQNILEFIKFLLADIAMGCRLPYEVVLSLANLGGATARGALEDAQWLFDMVQDQVIWTLAFPIYRWRVAKFMKEGRLRQCRDPFWWTTTWRGPAKLTVDMGRTAQANIELMRNGMLSHSRFYNSHGLEAQDEWDQQIEDLRLLQEKCAKAGVDINRILMTPPGSVTQVQVPEEQK